MIKTRVMIAAAAAVVMSFSGCAAVGRWQTLKGVVFWSAGNFQSATAAFLKAKDDAEKRGDERLAAYASYGLASAYICLNENASAENLLLNLRQSDYAPISSSAYYAMGILNYRNADYAAAEEMFRKSLQIEPNRRDARVNLELSRRARTGGGDIDGARVSTPTQNDSVNSDLEESLYTILRAKEQNRWVRPEEPPYTQKTLDY